MCVSSIGNSSYRPLCVCVFVCLPLPLRESLQKSERALCAKIAAPRAVVGSGGGAARGPQYFAREADSHFEIGARVALQVGRRLFCQQNA